MRRSLIFLLLFMLPAPTFASAENAVVRAGFTSAVVDREPVDRISRAGGDTRTLIYFSEIRGMAGHTIRHRWLYQGKVKAEVPFVIGGPRWRIWSSKRVLPRWSGEWTVQVVDEDDRILAEDSITYEAGAGQEDTQQ